MAENTDEAYSLGEVVVLGKKPGVEATQTVREVSAADIETSGAQTLDEALNLLPGLNVRTGGEGVPRIDIRGFRTRHVLLLLDGIPINSAFDQQFDPSIIPVENIAQIKVTSGPSSVLYGQGGLGGVINIITKRGTKGIHGTLSGETGDHQPYLGKASVSGSKGMFDFFISGSACKTNGYSLSEDFVPTSLESGGYRKNSDKERNNFFANMGFSPIEELTFGLTVSYQQGEYGLPVSVIPDSADPFASKPKFERIDDFEGYSVQLAGDYDPSGPFSLRSWFFINQLSQQDNTYDNSNFDSFNLSGSSRLHDKSVVKGLSLQPKYEFGKSGVVTAGFSAERDSFDQHGFQMGGGGSGSGGGGGGGKPKQTGVNLEKALTVYSATIEYEISPTDNLGFVAGYGHHWQDRAEEGGDGFSVLAGAHYDILKDTRLKGAFQRNIRFPSLRQLYDTKNGNQALESEVAYLYELGLEQKLPGNSLAGITGFYTDVKNFIQKNELTNLYENLEKGRFSGFEALLETRFLKNLMVRATYTYLNAEDRSGTGKDVVQYSPRDKLTFEGKYDFDFGFTPYVSVLYVANQYFFSKANAGPLMKMKLGNYSVVNAKLNQKLADGLVNLYVGADNIFDTNYETSYGFPQAGRFIYGGIRISM